MSVNLAGDEAQKFVKTRLEACLQSMKDIKNLREDVKGYLDELKEKYDLEPKTVRKTLKVLLDQSLSDMQESLSDVESLVALSENVKI